MQMVLKIIAGVFISIAVGVTLHQILVYGVWEWDEVFSVYHHEGIAVATALVGLLLYLLSRLGRQ